MKDDDAVIAEVLGTIRATRCDRCGDTRDKATWMIAMLSIDQQGCVDGLLAMSTGCASEVVGAPPEIVQALAEYRDTAREEAIEEAKQEARRRGRGMSA